jgi:hypothetical protein
MNRRLARSTGWADQSRSWRTQSLWAFPAVDAEQDDCDREDDDANEDKQQQPEMTPCS